MKIRTWYDLGDFCDHEVNTQPSRVEDADWFETLEQMVPRIQAGQIRVRPSDLYEIVDGDVESALDDEPVIERLDDLTDIDRSMDVVAAYKNKKASRNNVAAAPVATTEGDEKEPEGEAQGDA